jgi:hypothetical protein
MLIIANNSDAFTFTDFYQNREITEREQGKNKERSSGSVEIASKQSGQIGHLKKSAKNTRIYNFQRRGIGKIGSLKRV